MTHVNQHYINQYQSVVREYRAEGMCELALMIAKYERDKGIDSMDAKRFLVDMIYSPRIITDRLFFNTICAYGLRYDMNVADVLTLISIKGAFDEMASGSAPGVFVVQ